MTVPTFEEQADSCFRLVVRQGLTHVVTYDLMEDHLTVGRTSSCTLRLNHESVSRRHARFERRGNGWYLVDTGSANGVFVNRQAVQERRIGQDDIVEIGPFALHVQGKPEAHNHPSLVFDDDRAEYSITRQGGDSLPIGEHRLQDLYMLSRLVLQEREQATLWSSIHSSLQRCVVADRCVLVGVDGEGLMFRMSPRPGVSAESSPLGVSRSVAQKVIASKRGVLLQRSMGPHPLSTIESLAASHVGSVMCVPVIVQDQVRALAYLDRKTGRSPFQTEDLNFVTAALDMAAAGVCVDELQMRARELALVQGRIEAAREMQKLLLPHPLPQPPWGDLAAVNYPAEHMSGDTYDVAVDPRGRLLVMIADVAGKGVPAAFAAAVLQTAFRQALCHVDSLAVLVGEMNRCFEAYSPSGCFATCITCRWSIDGNQVEIANAGHHAPVWRRLDGTTRMFPDAMGLPLGILPHWNGEIKTETMAAGDSLVLCSDGLTEARDACGKEYTMVRLAESVASRGGTSAQQEVEKIIDGLRRFCPGGEPTDDATVVCVHRR